MKRRALALALLVLAPLRAAPPSAADLLRSPEVSRATLSPDGKQVLFVEGVETDVLLVHDLESGRRRRQVVLLDGSPRSTLPGIVVARWLGPERVLLGFNYAFASVPTVITTNTALPPTVLPLAGPGMTIVPRAFSGYVAVDVTGKRQFELPSLALRSDTVPANLTVNFAWDTRRIFVPPAENGVILAPAFNGPPNGTPDVARIDTVNGRTTRIVGNPGRVTEWIFERNGRSALGVDASGATVKLLSPEKQGDKWREVGDLGEPRSRLRLDLFDAGRGLVYGSRLGTDGRWSFGAFKLKEAQWTPIVTSPRYDIGAPDHRAAFAGLDLNEVVFSPKTGLPLAVGCVNDGPRQQWLGGPLNQAMREMAENEPGMTSFVIDVDRGETRALVLSWSAQQPGFYSVLDLGTKKATRVAERMPWLRSAALGEMFPITCAARDGTELDAYFTVPPGAQPKNLPLVVLLRESPVARETWAFQPLVQFLATRGYAVLQVNHRGSSGYGEAFQRAGVDDPGGVVQDDVIDAVRAVMARGMVDARRVAIVGTFFGGHSALLALAREPEMFRCGAALTPITDWRELAREKDSVAYRYWFESMGLFPGARSETRLLQASAIQQASRITKPLLLVHAEADRRASGRATKAFAEAVKTAGAKPETFFHGAARGERDLYEKKQVEIAERLAAFLAQHMPVRP